MFVHCGSKSALKGDIFVQNIERRVSVVYPLDLHSSWADCHQLLPGQDMTLVGIRTNKIFCFFGSFPRSHEMQGRVHQVNGFQLMWNKHFTGSVLQALEPLSQGPSERKTLRCHLAEDPFSGSEEKQQYKAA